MGMNYLFDTNTVIYFLGKIVLSDDALKHIDTICAQGQHLSIITKLELLGYHFENTANEKSTEKFVSASKIYQISPEIEVETNSASKSNKNKTS